MSMHKKPLTALEEAGLRAHGLDIGKPSQLSDVFRQGIAYALARSGAAPVPVEPTADPQHIADLLMESAPMRSVAARMSVQEQAALILAGKAVWDAAIRSAVPVEPPPALAKLLDALQRFPQQPIHVYGPEIRALASVEPPREPPPPAEPPPVPDIRATGNYTDDEVDAFGAGWRRAWAARTAQP